MLPRRHASHRPRRRRAMRGHAAAFSNIFDIFDFFWRYIDYYCRYYTTLLSMSMPPFHFAAYRRTADSGHFMPCRRHEYADAAGRFTGRYLSHMADAADVKRRCRPSSPHRRFIITIT